MNIGMPTRLVLILLAAAWAISAHAQSAAVRRPTASLALVSPSAPIQSVQATPSMMIREIDDRHTGDRWFLMRDPSRPSAPGCMVLAAAGARQVGQREQRETSLAATQETNHELPIPSIHSGDRLIVEEKTPMVETRLEAVALGQAVNGAPLNVRLVMSGNIVQAVALGPGRAVFAQRVRWQP